jgi:hypothetical protein
MDCILCVGKREDADHLFMFCEFASGVWSRIIRWLGFEFVMPQNPFSFFDCFVGAASSKKLAKVFALVWHTTRYGRFGDLETRCHSQMGLETWQRWLTILRFSLGVGGWHGGRSKFACFSSGVANPEYVAADLCSVRFIFSVSLFSFSACCALVWSVGLAVGFCFPVL